MKSLVLVGRRWFNKLKGHTYHSVKIIVDGKQVGKIDYAHGTAWQDSAASWLEANHYMPHRAEAAYESMYTYCERMAITYTGTVSEVQRKKDL